jgi:hypothetical protein
MTQKTVIISCGIFQEELQYLVKAKGLNWKIIYLDAALHVNFDRLRQALTRALAENQKAGVKIKVIYGRCHPQMQELLRQYNAHKISAGNCLEALVGPEKIRRLNEAGKAFFLTAGWISNWEAIFDLGTKDYGFDFQTMFDGYRQVIVFETGILPVDEEKVKQFSRYANLPVRRERITLDYFFNLINNTE